MSTSTIQKHLKEPNVSIDEYVRRSNIALGASLADKAPVYLDMNYWIWMRDPDRHTNPDKARDLLTLLEQGVAERKLFCPISQSTFFELLKQSDAKSREATARLVDGLSLGVTFIEEEMRAAAEVEQLLYKFSTSFDLHPVDHLVWTRLAFAAGILHPTNTPFDPETELAIQKAFFDHMSSMCLADVVGYLSEPYIELDGMQRVADSVNSGNQAHAHEVKSFSQAYAAEVKGFFDISLDGLPDLLVEMARKSGQPIAKPNAKQRQETIAQYATLFSHTLRQGKERKTLRTAHISACLHASLRWDKSRKLKPNDIYDFHHAIAALAYCKAFLTEKSIKNTVEQKHLQLADLYDCSVVTNIDDALSTVSDLVA